MNAATGNKNDPALSSNRHATKVRESAHNQHMRDNNLIQSLQQELNVVKREKKFIQEKLEQVTANDEITEQ